MSPNKYPQFYCIDDRLTLSESQAYDYISNEFSDELLDTGDTVEVFGEEYRAIDVLKAMDETAYDIAVDEEIDFILYDSDDDTLECYGLRRMPDNPDDEAVFYDEDVGEFVLYSELPEHIIDNNLAEDEETEFDNAVDRYGAEAIMGLARNHVYNRMSDFDLSEREIYLVYAPSEEDDE